MTNAAYETEAVHLSAQQVADDLLDLMARLNLATAAQLAALLRSPGDDYPTAAQVRLYRLGRQAPTARFSTLLAVRRAEIERDLAAGALAPQQDGPETVRIEPRRYMVHVLEPEDIERAAFLPADAAGALVSAALAVPREWLHRCEVCGRPFIARTARSRYCYRRDEAGRYACRREAARRRKHATS